jgi:hypothetical protein
MTLLFFHRTACLPWIDRAVIMRMRLSMLAVLALAAQSVVAQENKPEPAREELDVTMQIITDPDAKQPDDIVRRIQLPPRKSAEERASKPSEGESSEEPSDKGQERAREAQELGKEMSDRANEQAQEAAEQREKARRSENNERRPPGPPADPPRPPRPNPARP